MLELLVAVAVIPAVYLVGYWAGLTADGRWERRRASRERDRLDRADDDGWHGLTPP